jgi:L-ornithine N5-monooxygenase
VNEIFNPSTVNTIYTLPRSARQALYTSNRATNYSVVRPELLESLYAKLYTQHLHYATESAWPHRIIPHSTLTSAKLTNEKTLDLMFSNPLMHETTSWTNIDLLILGTGYTREAHKAILQPVAHLLENCDTSDVRRDYSLKFKPDTVSARCGIWLQGCCEASHGLSDSLLSILAVRAGELVQSIFDTTATNGDSVIDIKKEYGLYSGSNGSINGVNGQSTINGFQAAK